MTSTGDVSAPAQRTSIRSHASNWTLVLLAIVSAAIYGYIAYLSDRFAYGSVKLQRPIPVVLGWFTGLFLLHLAALFYGLRIQSKAATTLTVVMAAVAFRAIMLSSEPIQEIDIYRYLWDGIASSSNVSPFKYTPEEVVESRGVTGLPADLSALVAAGEATEATREILRRVHFADVPTVYPPTSQWAFHLIERLNSPQTNLPLRLLKMRIWLTCCDLSTLLVLLVILSRTGKHPAYAILYGWSPLVVKEIANSGHLDSMAVLLTTIGVYFCVRLLQRDTSTRFAWPTLFDSVGAAVGIALGIGAKIYPVVLLPWFAALTVRRLGFRALIPMATVGLLSLLILKPMFWVDAREAESTLRPPSDGIKTFVKYWEMNDFLFLLTVENLRPDSKEARAPWFVVLPNSLRQRLATALESWTGLPPTQATFQAARVITVIVLAVIVLSICWAAWKTDDTHVWLRAAFLTLAWFWLLSPTQNPWYWIWAMPLLPFARYRAWYLVSGVTLLYYLRFWFEYHFPAAHVGNTPYVGTQFFDFVVTWLEFAPWLTLLAIEALWRRPIPNARS